MAESGDWVTPRLYGVPWFEKPVLYYWEAAVSFKIFGVTEAAARLPSAISALIATLALGWLAWRVYGVATARWFLILLPSSVGMIGFSHAAATDMPFAGMISVAMVCAAVVLGLVRGSGADVAEGVKDEDAIGLAPGQAGAQHAAPLQRLTALVLFGVFLGLAVLAKGPAAIILCGGGVFFWAIFTRRWRDAFRLLHPAAVLAFCVTALPWYVLCARRNPDFFRIFIIEHNFKRYLTPEFQHVQPFWYYVPVLLVAFLPLVGLFLWSAAVGTKEVLRRRMVSHITLLLICWSTFCILFFSTSHSKLPGYILPAFPAVGLLVARTFVLLGPQSRWSYQSMGFFGSALCLFASLGQAFIRSRGFVPVEAVGAFSAVLVLLGAASLGFSFLADRRTNPLVAATFASVSIMIAMTVASSSAQKFFRRDPSARAMASEIQRKGISGKLISVTGMNRGLQYGLGFYLHEEIQNWTPASETGGYLLTGSKNCEAVVGAGFYCEAQPFDLNGAGTFLYLVIPIAGGK